MRTATCAMLLTILAGSAAALDFQLSATAGMGFSAGSSNSPVWGYELASWERTETASGDYLYDNYNDEYVSFGNGLKFDLEFALMLNDNVGVILGSGVSFLGGRIIEQIEHEDDGTQWSLELELDGNYVPLVMGMRLSAELGRVEPYAYIAPGLFFPVGIGGDALESETGQADELTEIEVDVATGFGITGGIGVAIPMGKNLGFRVELCPTYAFARVEEVTTVTTGNGSTYTVRTIYRDDEAILPSPSISLLSATFYNHGRPTLSFSSVGARCGILISF